MFAVLLPQSSVTWINLQDSLNIRLTWKLQQETRTSRKQLFAFSFPLRHFNTSVSWDPARASFIFVGRPTRVSGLDWLFSEVKKGVEYESKQQYEGRSRRSADVARLCQSSFAHCDMHSQNKRARAREFYPMHPTGLHGNFSKLVWGAGINEILVFRMTNHRKWQI